MAFRRYRNRPVPMLRRSEVHPRRPVGLLPVMDEAQLVAEVELAANLRAEFGDLQSTWHRRFLEAEQVLTDLRAMGRVVDPMFVAELEAKGYFVCLQRHPCPGAALENTMILHPLAYSVDIGAAYLIMRCPICKAEWPSGSRAG